MRTVFTLAILFFSIDTANAFGETKILDDFLLSQASGQYETENNQPKTTKQEIEELKARVAELEDLKEEVRLLKTEVDILKAFDISGFFDVNISNYKNKPNIFSIGSFELDIEHNYKHFQVAAALVFDEGAELGVGFIDYHIFGSRISPRGRLFRGEGLHVQIGKFDVPFGNDWYEYSPDARITVTPPLTTDIIMDGGYNDEGVRILLNFIAFNATLYMLDGIEEKYTYGGNSFGGRVGLTPFSNPYELSSGAVPVFETGFSCIYDIDREGAAAEKIFAVDLKSKAGPIILSSEYYRRDKNAGILLYGYHVTAGFDFSYLSIFPVIIFGRYEQSFSEEFVSIDEQEGINKKKLTRLTGGLNINISNISYLKFEYQNYLNAYDEYKEDQYYSKMLYYLQLVITF
ncbi:MAG: hypothetical protein JW864_15510 [Spirochaetes bacterium]|nr:hypothetical protein [Spirochaetota bacterium]